MEGSVEDLVLNQKTYSSKPHCAGIILGMINFAVNLKYSSQLQCSDP